VVAAASGISGEMLQEQFIVAPASARLEAGTDGGTAEWDVRIGQFLPAQHAREAQQLMCWSGGPGSEMKETPERRIESVKAQALVVIFMPRLVWILHQIGAGCSKQKASHL
jgi:hypothetical protein